MALSNGERQRRYRARRATGEPVRQFTTVVVATGQRRTRRWADAGAELRALQAEYEVWRDPLPESLAGSPTAELLERVCAVDLDTLDVELPRGFGRD